MKELWARFVLWLMELQGFTGTKTPEEVKNDGVPRKDFR